MIALTGPLGANVSCNRCSPVTVAWSLLGHSLTVIGPGMFASVGPFHL